VPKSAFFSFHYKPDNWRASQVRNIGAIEGNASVSDNDWEAIARRGDDAIQRWIDSQMNGKSCAVVLIGSATANRKWINYETVKAWNDRRGVLGIYVHNLKDVTGAQSLKGSNPFDYITLGDRGRRLSSVVQAYDPPYVTSTDVYGYIANNIEAWIDAAISSRQR
jgi:Thoeris protein ThsB, TIR-like domain